MCSSDLRGVGGAAARRAGRRGGRPAHGHPLQGQRRRRKSLGGQRQRPLIARALVHKPRLLLFDEATSALDNRSQAAISANLARVRATRIVVAHRLSTIREADRICVLEGGRVVQQGSYDALMAVEGPFRRLAGG